MLRPNWLIMVALVTIVTATANAEDKIKALIIDGQNNHGDWPKNTAIMKRFLEKTDRFTVDVERTQFTWKGDQHFPEYALKDKKYEAGKAKPDPDFKPNFSNYDVVISNFGFGAAAWPKETQVAFENFVAEGGGLVVTHAADNSFGDWPEYNEMIGVGGWGGRNKKSGPYVYWDEGTIVRDEKLDGPGGSHGAQHEFSVIVRDANHPITHEMPREWKHTKDELYDSLRGPAANMRVLATSFSKKTKRHEPMIMTIDYDDGRVFHTPMGHADYSVLCAGFKATFLRGTEWAATGEVTIPIPKDFPGPEKSVPTE